MKTVIVLLTNYVFLFFSVSSFGQVLGDGAGGSNGSPITIGNASSTGTTLYTLTKLTGAPSLAVKAATTDTSGIVGITIVGAGTTGFAQVATRGLVNCITSTATTAGHYVQISSTVAGNCKDSGSATPPTSGGQIIGRFMTTNASAGTDQINLFSDEIQPSGSGPSGPAGPVGPTGPSGPSGAAFTPTVLTSGSCPVTDPGGSNVLQYNNSSGACTFNIQAGVSGYERRYRNATGKSGSITIQMPASNTVDLNGVNSSVASSLFSSGSLADEIVLRADTANHWYATKQTGSWQLTATPPVLTMVSDMGPVPNTTTLPGSALYASPAGSGSTCSAGSPCSITQVKTSARGGTKNVVLLGGRYTLSASQVFDFNDDGQIWVAYPNQIPIIDYTNTYLVTITGSHNVTFKGITFQNLAAGGIQCNGCQPLNLQWNTFDSCQDICVQGSFWTNSTIDSNIISNEVLGHPVGNTGIFYAPFTPKSGSAGNTFSHNYFHDNNGCAIAFAIGPTDFAISNNIIDRNIAVNVCKTAVDAAPWYVFDGSNASTGMQWTNNYVDTLGNGSAVANAVQCIYFDTFASHQLADHNYCKGGMAHLWQIHGGDHNTIQNNFANLSSGGPEIGFYQATSTPDPNNMTANVETGEVVYSSSTYAAHTYAIQSVMTTVNISVSGNIYSSATFASIPNSADIQFGTLDIIDSAPLFGPPGAALLNFKPSYLP